VLSRVLSRIGCFEQLKLILPPDEAAWSVSVTGSDRPFWHQRPAALSAICRFRATRSPLISTTPVSMSCWPVQSYFS